MASGNNFGFAPSGGGGGSTPTPPAGSNTYVQYNDVGAFGGDENFTWNKSTFVLAVNGQIEVISATQQIKAGYDNVNYFTTSVDVSGNTTFLITSPSATPYYIFSYGLLRFGRYGSGSITGTAAYNLQVDSSGNVIEGSLGGASITINSTPITGGADGRILFESASNTVTSLDDFRWDTTYNYVHVKQTGLVPNGVVVQNAVSASAYTQITHQSNGFGRIYSSEQLSIICPFSLYLMVGGAVSADVNLSNDRAIVKWSGNFLVGTTSDAGARIYSVSTTEQFRAAYDGSNYVSTQVNGVGGVIYTAIGSYPAHNFIANDTINRIIASFGIDAGNGQYITIGQAGGMDNPMQIKTNYVTTDYGLTIGTYTIPNLILINNSGVVVSDGVTHGLGFYGTSAIVQQNTGVSSSTYVSVGGTAVQENDTFDGYTIGQIVKAIRNLGLIA